MATFKKIMALCAVMALTGCTTISGIGEDNTPAPSELVAYHAQFTPQKNWSLKTDDTKTVTAFTLSNGKIFLRSPLNQTLVAGPSIGNNMIIAGDNDGDIWSLSLQDGKTRWKTRLSDPMVSPALISGNSIYVRTLDGTVWALNSSDGSVRWQSPHSVHTMVLSGGSKPVLMGNNLIIGSSSGTLTSFDAKTGAVKWKTVIAQPQGASDVEKMVDITANPKISGDTMYVVTYQGNLAAVNIQSGQINWQTPLSSYTGLAVSPSNIFVTDAKGRVLAFNRSTGKSVWKQSYLKYRLLTAPVTMGNNIVVGDGEGYLHWLNQSTGQTVARTEVSSAPIISAPVVQGNTVYVLSQNGLISGYTY